MSARATSWAWDQPLPPAEKLVLLAIADNAGKDEAWLWGAQAEMAAQTGMGERTVRRHLVALEERGLIRREATYEAGLRMPDHIRLALDDALPANLAGSDEVPANAGTVPANLASGQFGRAHLSSTLDNKERGLEKKDESGQFGRAQIDALPPAMRADVIELLKQGRKVDRRKVTEVEMLIAAAALAEFNRLAGSDYGLGASLTGIVMRIRERPNADAAAHVRLVQSAFRIRWWEKRGNGHRVGPQVIYGERCFERVWQDAIDEAAALRELEEGCRGRLKDRTYRGRSWDELTSREQEHAKEAASMGLEVWDGGKDAWQDRPAQLAAGAALVANGNGHADGYSAENILDD